MIPTWCRKYHAHWQPPPVRGWVKVVSTVQFLPQVEITKAFRIRQYASPTGGDLAANGSDLSFLGRFFVVAGLFHTWPIRVRQPNSLLLVPFCATERAVAVRQYCFYYRCHHHHRSVAVSSWATSVAAAVGAAVEQPLRRRYHRRLSASAVVVPHGGPEPMCLL